MDLSALARRVLSGIGQPCGFLRWIRQRKPLFSKNSSLFERSAVSAQTGLVLFVLSSKPSRRRALISGGAGLGEFYRPTRVAVFVGELGGIGVPALGNPAYPERRLLFLAVALLGADISEASTIWPPMAMYPAARSTTSKRSANGLIASAFVSFSRNSHIARA